MAMCVQCEDCKFANWDATLFRDHEDGRWEGGHYIPPYNEQFDVYCIKHERFFMEQEITGDCQDDAENGGDAGDDNTGGGNQGGNNNSSGGELEG